MKILLVDDEEDIRKIGALSLGTVGKFDVLVASCAQEAIECATEAQPDLVLMDMMMPGMDGLSALAQLRSSERTRHIPVVFMTAKVQPSEVAHYLEKGALGVIPKPFDPMALPDQIRALVAGR